MSPHRRNSSWGCAPNPNKSTHKNIFESATAPSGSLHSLNFDAYSCSQERLVSVAVDLLKHSHVLEEFGTTIEDVRNFVDCAAEKYEASVPYHNWTHAVDVLQAALALAYLVQNDDNDVLQPRDIAVLAVAALTHDLGHPGFDNSFLKSSGSERNIYRESLEEHHADLACEIFGRTIGKNLSHEEQDNVKSMVSQIILSTDMAIHNDVLATVLSCNSRIATLQAIMKSADLANVFRPIRVSYVAACRLREEMFRQGDREKSMGLNVPPFRDRLLDQQTSLCAWQLQFLDLFVTNMFHDLVEKYPCLSPIQKIISDKREVWAKLNDKTDPEGSGLFPLRGALVSPHIKPMLVARVDTC